MENLILLLAASLGLHTPPSKFRRYPIGHSGCSALFFPGANTLHVQYTSEGDKIYFNDHTVKGVTYGLIAVQMKEVFTLREAEKILTHYVNRLRKPFLIEFNLSMEIKSLRTSLELIDYWQDKEGRDWKIKGYTNGKTIAVLYVKNLASGYIGDQESFLNSIKFSRIR